MISTQEERRLALQSELDAQKTQSERNRLGQFATPPALALDILNYAATLLSPSEMVRFLDPAIGTGALYAALRTVFPQQRIAEALGFEIDPHYKDPASQLWAESGLRLQLADFTREPPSPRFNLIVCNPPYVRHHHLPNSEKSRLRMLAHSVSGIKMSGLAGLYCYFLSLAHAWMAEDGVAGWLVPSEFMDVNYGEAMKRYLLNKVTLLHIHRFDPNDVQFADAFVSSAIVWFRKSVPQKDHTVAFTFGGTLLAPRLSRKVSSNTLAHESKWTRFPAAALRRKPVSATLSDFFAIKRGLATGDNAYFILDAESIISRNLPREAFRPILPSPRYLPDNEIREDECGLPLLERQLFLLDAWLPEAEIEKRFPTLFTYLQEGRSRAIHERYLCRHREPWYSQEKRPPAPIVCTYLGRGTAKSERPFRFILNHSKATVANVYLALYPTPRLAQAMQQDPTLIRQIWERLNQLTTDQLLSEGRVYGGGLYKLEPNELANVAATTIAELIPDFQVTPTSTQLALFGDNKKERPLSSPPFPAHHITDPPSILSD